MATLVVVAHDTPTKLREKLRTAHDEAFKNRIKAVVLALEGKKRYEIATQLAVDDKSVTTFTDFDADEYKFFWKIDYYTPDMQHGSEDPADPVQTLRVLTLMLAEEY